MVKLREKVEVLAEERTEMANRLGLVLQELEELRGPRDEAIGFLKTENTVIICKNYIYQKKM